MLRPADLSRDQQTNQRYHNPVGSALQRSGGFLHLWKTQHLAPAALDERAKAVVPSQQGVAHWPRIGGPVVDPRHATPMTRIVVQDRLNDVWLDAILGHPGGNRSANVMQ